MIGSYYINKYGQQGVNIDFTCNVRITMPGKHLVLREHRKIWRLHLSIILVQLSVKNIIINTIRKSKHLIVLIKKVISASSHFYHSVLVIFVYRRGARDLNN